MVSLQPLIISLIAISVVLSVGAAPLETNQVCQQSLRGLVFPLNHTFSHILATCLAPKQIYFTAVLTDIPVTISLEDPVQVYLMISLDHPIINISVQDPDPVIITIPLHIPVPAIIHLH